MLLFTPVRCLTHAGSVNSCYHKNPSVPSNVANYMRSITLTFLNAGEKRKATLEKKSSSIDFFAVDDNCQPRTGLPKTVILPLQSMGPTKPQGTLVGAYQGAVEMY